MAEGLGGKKLTSLEYCILGNYTSKMMEKERLSQKKN